MSSLKRTIPPVARKINKQLEKLDTLLVPSADAFKDLCNYIAYSNPNGRGLKALEALSSQKPESQLAIADFLAEYRKTQLEPQAAVKLAADVSMICPQYLKYPQFIQLIKSINKIADELSFEFAESYSKILPGLARQCINKPISRFEEYLEALTPLKGLDDDSIYGILDYCLNPLLTESAKIEPDKLLTVVKTFRQNYSYIREFDEEELDFISDSLGTFQRVLNDKLSPKIIETFGTLAGRFKNHPEYQESDVEIDDLLPKVLRFFADKISEAQAEKFFCDIAEGLKLAGEDSIYPIDWLPFLSTIPHIPTDRLLATVKDFVANSARNPNSLVLDTRQAEFRF